LLAGKLAPTPRCFWCWQIWRTLDFFFSLRFFGFVFFVYTPLSSALRVSHRVGRCGIHIGAVCWRSLRLQPKFPSPPLRFLVVKAHFFSSSFFAIPFVLFYRHYCPSSVWCFVLFGPLVPFFLFFCLSLDGPGFFYEIAFFWDFACADFILFWIMSTLLLSCIRPVFSCCHASISLVLRHLIRFFFDVGRSCFCLSALKFIRICPLGARRVVSLFDPRWKVFFACCWSPSFFFFFSPFADAVF